MKIQINPEKLFKILVSTVVVLAVLYLGTRVFILRGIEDPALLTALRIFDLDEEVSIYVVLTNTIVECRNYCVGSWIRNKTAAGPVVLVLVDRRRFVDLHEPG